MRIVTLFRLRMVCGVALVAGAVPGFAQNAAPISAAVSDTLAVRMVAATAARRATNLQRPPIAIDLFNVVAVEDRTGQSGRTAIAASSLSRPGRN